MSNFPLDRIRAVVDKVRSVADDANLKWGYGRLRLLVDHDLRGRFDRQLRKFETVCADDRASAAEIEFQGDALLRGYDALDKAAAAAGCEPLSSDVFEFPLQTKDGKKIAGVIVRDGRDVARIDQLDREIVVFTLTELTALLSGKHLLGLVDAKKIFPGAEVVDLNEYQAPLDDGDTLGDLWAAG